MKLLRVDTLDEAMEKLLRAAVMLPLNTQQIRTEEAVGRVLAGDIVSAEDIPGFRRSTVDGLSLIHISFVSNTNIGLRGRSCKTAGTAVL